MRSRVPLFTLLFVVSLFGLPLAAHAGIPFFGPIIPGGEFAKCPAGWGMLITVINNIISLLLTLAIVFVAPLMIAYSGFLFVVNPMNESGISKAKGILTNTVVGIVIALAGWMIVAAIMAALYSAPSGWGTWSNLITGSGDACLQQQGAPYTPGPPPPPTAVTTAPGTGRFTFNPGIQAQVPNESAALASLLTCMSSKLTANAIITSISDSKITSGQQTFSSCRTNGSPTCAHTRNSCHYGGTSCGDSSYAVDLVGNTSNLTAAVQACGGRVLNEGSHLHASVGRANNCGCDNF